MSKKVLLAGESWISYTTHTKGVDSFYTSLYAEGADTLIKAMEDSGFEVNYMPNHLIPDKFPTTMEELKKYDCVIFSDVGSNTLLLSPDTFIKSLRIPNRCTLIRDYVLGGGAFLMVGGYMSFSGVDAKAKYGVTDLQEVLPVECLMYDDLIERPEGIVPKKEGNHPALKDVPEDWPHFLGYNRTIILEEAELAMTIGGDPFIAFGKYGEGRSGVFTSDCAPHWGPPEFVNWTGYTPLWKGILDYLLER